MFYLVYLPLLGFLILFYFRVALKFNIVDKPNHRSSHSRPTIRGGGIIFPIALTLQAVITDFQYPLFTLGLLLISAVSFYDDLRPLSNKIRILIHLAAVSLLFMEGRLMEFPVWVLVAAYVLVIGTINAYNFMDGINGITGVYSLVTLSTMFYMNETQVPFVASEPLVVSILSLLVFNFFNFRRKAKCFAGDVGSVSMAFIIIFFLLLLILKSGDLKYIGLLLFYGLDSITTIIFRIFRKENIFEAHRSHFYQFLVNNLHWPHLRVSTLYAAVQLIFNTVLIQFSFNIVLLTLFFVISGLLFITVRFCVEGKSNLLHPTN